MTGADEITVLRRTHELFAGNPSTVGAGPAADAVNVLRQPSEVTGSGFARYRSQADVGRSTLISTGGVDERLNSILQGAVNDHTAAAQRTRVILDAARADTVPAGDTPMGQRELMARRAARLRAQHRILMTTRARALRRLALIRALRYRGIDPSRLSSSLRIPGAPNPRAAIAVKFALSKMGLPYVWGATGPNSYDCSGLTQAAWKAAGIDISRTTYTQIDHGVPVPRSMAAPGDLVFPHAGHVQMYIGNNQVVEAPHSGANVRISQMAANVQIRRPLAA